MIALIDKIHVKNRLHSYPRCPNRAPELFHVELRASINHITLF
jgi:hypothetical protein